MAIVSNDISVVKPVSQLPIPDNGGVNRGYTVDTANAVKFAGEVILNTNGNIRPRTLGTQYPIGIANNDGLAGEKVTVACNFKAIKRGANATGGVVNAGVFLKPSGTQDANGYDNYVAVAALDFVYAITLNSVANLGVVELGLLETPFKN
jgi:hypothetical protein